MQRERDVFLRPGVRGGRACETSQPARCFLALLRSPPCHPSQPLTAVSPIKPFENPISLSIQDALVGPRFPWQSTVSSGQRAAPGRTRHAIHARARMPSVGDRSSDVDLRSAGLSLCLFSQRTRPVDTSQVVLRSYRYSSIVAHPPATYELCGLAGRRRCGDTTSAAAYIVFQKSLLYYPLNILMRTMHVTLMNRHSQ